MSAPDIAARKFEVAWTVQAAGRSYVVAKPLETGNFKLTNHSKLGGYSVEEWLDQPMSALSDNLSSRNAFAFCLRSAQDISRFEAGQIVELSE